MESASAVKRPRWLLGIGILVVVLVVGWFLILRSRSATGQPVPAFHISEAGVHYVLHVLNSGACTPHELMTQQPLVQMVPDTTGGESLGTFAATFSFLSSDTPAQLQATVLGYGTTSSDACQKTEATIESFSGVLGTKYRVLGWETSATDCGEVPVQQALSCKGVSLE